MKKKVIKIKSAKSMTERLRGVGLWRITGPSESTGERVTVQFEGTRKEAESLLLK